MTDLNHVRKIFIRQLTQNDCGIACLSMILNYSGRETEVNAFREQTMIRGEGLSLLELRNLAAGLKLPARCVQMNIQFLRESSAPCILHMVNEYGENHFQVYCGAKKTRNGYLYLVADPARQVHYIPEILLEQQWQSKAALYFEEMPGSPKSTGGSSWAALLSMKLFPKALWIIVPFLNIFAAFLGIAMSWALQRGINDSLVGKKDGLVIAILLLLFIITLFKGFFSYIRQWILITVNNSVNDQLMGRYIRKIVRSSCNNFCIDQRSIKSSIGEIQKMQSAITAFMATLLSDGSLIVLMLCGIVYAMPLAGLINAVYIVVLTALTIRKLAGLSFKQADLNEHAAATENFMIRDFQSSIVETNDSVENRMRCHLKNHARFLGSARSIAVGNNKTMLLFECLGTLNVLLVFTLGLLKLKQENMGYGSFMVLVILSYFVAAMMPKICNALYIISDGAEASLQYRAQIPSQL